MKYIDYYPPVLKEVYEIQKLAEAMDFNFDELKLNEEVLAKELFVLTAENTGLERLEKAFNITVTDTDVDVRRKAILAKFSNNLTLIENLNLILGAGNYNLLLSVNKCTMDLDLFINSSYNPKIAKVVYDMLDRILPANIAYSINDSVTNSCSLYTGAVAEMEIEIDMTAV